jgi:choline dehydrogenase-like flavoprotein
MFHLLTRNEPFDAIIVGSGATGGWAAKQLTEAGLRVALLEAGEETSGNDMTSHACQSALAYEPPSSQVTRDRPVQANCYACREPRHKWFVNDFENPYEQATPYQWIRMRVLGGRLLAWEGQCYRMGDFDFLASRHDGYGADWPISYADLAPYYDQVERYIGVTGRSENAAYLPNGIFLPSRENNLTEEILRHSVGMKFNRVITPARLAVMTRGLGDDCHTATWDSPKTENYNGPVFTTPWRPIVDAANTGRLTLITNAIVGHILMKRGKASGVVYVDRNTLKTKEVFGKIIMLCASTLESTRILLNSKICNSSGTLGRYLMDHIFGVGATATVAVDGSRILQHGRMPHRIYIPRFRNITEKATNGFIRGYGIQGKILPVNDVGSPCSEANIRKGSVQTKIILTAFGECLARYENFVDTDPQSVDAWGIPVLRIHAKWSNNEIALCNDASAQAAEMLENSNVKEVTLRAKPFTPGLCIHETGTARMGNNPKTSVVNRYCQAHDVPNIFVTDGACWVSSGSQNPTLSMMAITVRACDYIIWEYFKTQH